MLYSVYYRLDNVVLNTSNYVFILICFFMKFLHKKEIQNTVAQQSKCRIKWKTSILTTVIIPIEELESVIIRV